MALKPEDPSGGFQHGEVVAFINDKMARHTKGPEFYLENVSLSWGQVEDKLRAIVEDSELPSEAKEACAWSSLALAVRFALRQEQLQGLRVQWLHEFSKLHRSAARRLSAEVKELQEKQKMEREEAVFHLRQTQTQLAQLQKELKLLRMKLLRVEEEEAAAATGAAGGEKEQDAEEAVPTEAAQEPGGDLQLLGAMEQKNYTSGGQGGEDLRSVETAMTYLSETLNLPSTSSQEFLPVQLPDSFTYSYECPFSPFPDTSPPAAVAPAAPQMPRYWGASDVTLWSDVGAQGIDPRDLQRDWRHSRPYQRRQVFRRPGGWNCSWCSTVNFSRREVCCHCGRGIWLQNPQ
ncbi:PREDICTED: testis-expressed sequence 13A protein [Galeopterus variegatus]|uniref:Testis-expressed sequence 13A protein n=1 Tax=Galeopterus variegatus TaxID=482537 RepID=A0ABM0RJ66_GALVR|nr:PREDICTED: testis-expressed sequence 13A protein [Galeopterus variegatus]